MGVITTVTDDIATSTMNQTTSRRELGYELAVRRAIEPTIQTDQVVVQVEVEPTAVSLNQCYGTCLRVAVPALARDTAETAAQGSGQHAVHGLRACVRSGSQG